MSIDNLPKKLKNALDNAIKGKNNNEIAIVDEDIFEAYLNFLETQVVGGHHTKEKSSVVAYGGIKLKIK